MGSRTWIKIYCDRWLNGTIREETPELRGIWVDLLVLAGSGKYGDSGEIKITDQLGYSDSQLAEILQISRQKWATIKKKLIETDRIMIKNLNKNEGVMSQNLNKTRGVITKNSNIILINNWSKYQSEYERQRGYRLPVDTNEKSPENSNQKLQSEVTTESTPREERGERGEGRLENIDNNTPSLYNLSPSKDDVLDFYRKNFGEIGEDMEKELELATTKFSASGVMEAIQEAVKRGKTDWRYIARILENWRKFGKRPRNKNDPDKFVKGKYSGSVRR